MRESVSGFWLLSRFSKVPLRSPLFLVLGGAVWNFGIVIGVLSVLGGGSTGRELLEFPPETAFILFLGLVMMSLSAITLLWDGKPEGPMFRSGIFWGLSYGSRGHMPRQILLWALHPLPGPRSRLLIGGISAV